MKRGFSNGAEYGDGMIKRAILILFLFVNIYSSEMRFIKLFIHDFEFNVEVAETEEQKMKGLMFRKSIPKDYGMIFIYEDEDFRAMWMKNTLIPLDLVFLNAEREVVQIIPDVPPCKNDPCETYPSKKKAKFVLELNAGMSKRMKLKSGDIIFFIL